MFVIVTNYRYFDDSYTGPVYGPFEDEVSALEYESTLPTNSVDYYYPDYDVKELEAP